MDKIQEYSWVQFSGIPALQESLYREQGYLCAYCERRIPVRDKMSTEDHRIEHWHCRDKYPDEVFCYGNLLMCCPGQIGGVESHCDVRKGNDIIEWSPLKKSVLIVLDIALMAQFCQAMQVGIRNSTKN